MEPAEKGDVSVFLIVPQSFMSEQRAATHQPKTNHSHSEWFLCLHSPLLTFHCHHLKDCQQDSVLGESFKAW